ncbi:MAG: cytochrome b/b6 domain-containing protein [Desulfobulbaceae bacterium]|nr:cytochrome b/b6 domain-containing protein [Desulfobulbaceae bacterium]
MDTYTTNNENSSLNHDLPTEVIRLNCHERIQHLLVFVTFILLVVTGYMLKLPETWILKLGDWGPVIFHYRGLTHRIVGVAMILAAMYHVAYLVACKDGRSFMKGMIPTWKDAKDIVHNIGYYLGRRKEPPKFARFDYREKAEYLALVAGTIIISVTGILLWSEDYWGKFVLDLSILIHGMEAILATLAIIVWHFYAVHWKPGQFPMSRVWIDGKMSAHHLKEEHPLQYEELVQAGKLAPVEDTDPHHHEPQPKGLKRGMLELASLGSIFFFAFISVLLMKLLYFPPAATSGIQAAGGGKFVEFISTEDLKKTDTHFHNVDKTVKLVIASPPICVTCHGTLPHGKSPDIRSFLNMHNYFMACETCHIRQDDSPGIVRYEWYDNLTEEKVLTIDENKFGNYGARLVPVATLDGESRRLDLPTNPDFIREYLAQKDNLTPEEQAKAKVILHRHMSKKPLQCTECHGREPYIQFAAVGYSRLRSESLYRTEVADMIDRYMKFYLPTMFDSDLMKQQKMQELQVEDRSTD